MKSERTNAVKYTFGTFLQQYLTQTVQVDLFLMQLREHLKNAYVPELGLGRGLGII